MSADHFLTAATLLQCKYGILGRLVNLLYLQSWPGCGFAVACSLVSAAVELVVAAEMLSACQQVGNSHLNSSQSIISQNGDAILAKCCACPSGTWFLQHAARMLAYAPTHSTCCSVPHIAQCSREYGGCSTSAAYTTPAAQQAASYPLAHTTHFTPSLSLSGTCLLWAMTRCMERVPSSGPFSGSWRHR